MNPDVTRCEWCIGDPLYEEYHDKDWGVPVHHDTKLFEMLTLEGAQAGLSWITVLRKRDSYREAFDQFDFTKIALYHEKKLEILRQNPGIIRNRLKIASTVTNARAFLKIREEFGSFDNYIWGFTKHKVIQNSFKSLKEVPPNTPLSDEISKDLKKRGFKFVGSTIVYAFMQSIGMVNDHIVNCFRHRQLQ